MRKWAVGYFLHLLRPLSGEAPENPAYGGVRSQDDPDRVGCPRLELSRYLARRSTGFGAGDGTEDRAASGAVHLVTAS
jgi:hypothetical protein